MHELFVEFKAHRILGRHGIELAREADGDLARRLDHAHISVAADGGYVTWLYVEWRGGPRSRNVAGD